MKCVDTGTMQAFIDGELEIAVKKDIEKHLADCSKCSEMYDSLKKNDDFVFGNLTAYRQFCEENYDPDTMEFTGSRIDTETIPFKKDVKGFMYKYRKIAAAACIFLTVTLCITVQPVRAFISEALNIFRVESVKGLKVSLSDMEKIRNVLSQKEGEISIDSMGKIIREGFDDGKVTIDEARADADFPLLLPPDNQDRDIKITSSEPGSITFTLKVGNVNETLKSLGAEKLLPENLDGKTFTAGFARQISFLYEEDGKTYRVVESRTPELAVPADVNVDEIYDCLVELPIIPEDIRRQLKSIKDWKNTIYLPVIDAEPESVDVNGMQGFIAEKKNGDRSMLVWYNDGTIYSVDSNAGKDDLLKFARSLR